jgi:hypothetical protein
LASLARMNQSNPIQSNPRFSVSCVSRDVCMCRFGRQQPRSNPATTQPSDQSLCILTGTKHGSKIQPSVLVVLHSFASDFWVSATCSCDYFDCLRRIDVFVRSRSLLSAVFGCYEVFGYTSLCLCSSVPYRLNMLYSGGARLSKPTHSTAASLVMSTP